MKISIGTASFGMKYGISNTKKINKKEVFKILEYCKKKKILYLDTSQNYGNSEKILGKYNNLTKFQITTKINKKKFKNIYCSAQRLGQKPSAILFHNYKDYLDKNFRKKIYDEVQKLKIKNIGISIYYDDNINFNKIDKRINILQIPLNILDQRFLNNKNFIKNIKKRKIKLEIRSIFLQGLLFMQPERLEKLLGTNYNFKKLLNISSIYKISLLNITLNWLTTLKVIDKIIIGVNSLSQIKTNFKYKKKKLPLKLMQEIQKLKFSDKLLNPKKW